MDNLYVYAQNGNKVTEFNDILYIINFPFIKTVLGISVRVR
jgi:hypothetical protein